MHYPQGVRRQCDGSDRLSSVLLQAVPCGPGYACYPQAGTLRKDGARRWINPSAGDDAVTVRSPFYAACFTRLAIFAMVARLQPVALWIVLHDCPAAIMLAMPALRSVSSARPL